MFCPSRRHAIPVVGSVGSTSMNWSVTGCIPALGAGSESRGRQIITSGSTVSSSNRKHPHPTGLHSTSDFFGQADHTRRLPHRTPGKKLLGHGHQIVAVRGGGRSTTHFCLYNVYYYNNLSNRWTTISQLGTYSQTSLIMNTYEYLNQMHVKITPPNNYTSGLIKNPARTNPEHMLHACPALKARESVMVIHELATTPVDISPGGGGGAFSTRARA